jgi:hypothetical protein
LQRVVSPGTACTVAFAERHSKPHLIVDIGASDAVQSISAWLDDGPAIRTLNIAGPRESEAPGIYQTALSLITQLTRP